MPHSLIAGMTCTGKSSVAKLLVPLWRGRKWKGHKYRVAVLDPLKDPTWRLSPGDFISADPDHFIFYCKTQLTPLAIFVDEGAQSLSRGVDYNWLTTQARHWGHESHIISQRPTDLTPQIRGNCEWLYLFQTDDSAAKLLSREWNRPALLGATENPVLQFHLARRLAEVRIARVDHTKRSIVFLERTNSCSLPSAGTKRGSSGSSSGSHSSRLLRGDARAKRTA